MIEALEDAAVSGDADLLQPGLLHELFERQADTRPEAPALECAGARMSYGGLERRSNQLARLLRQRGVRRGDCVGLWLPRSMDALVALLGIMKAGAAYVPLDSECPADRAAFVLGDCHARAVVTTSAFAGRMGGWSAGVSVIAVDECAADLEAQLAARLRAAQAGLSPRDLCYVIYTSGTTGRPKGVEIEHRSACHLVRAEGRLFQVRPEDRVFQGFSVAFDASVEEIWLAFFAGATLVVGTAATYVGARRAQTVKTFSTTADLRAKLKAGSGKKVEAIFHAAAVSDFAFGQIFSETKPDEFTALKAVKKISTRQGSLLVELVPTPKIIAELRGWFPAAKIVGWKFEANGGRADALRAAQQQLAECATDFCVANGPAYGPGFSLVSAGGRRHFAGARGLFSALEIC